MCLLERGADRGAGSLPPSAAGPRLTWPLLKPGSAGRGAGPPEDGQRLVAGLRGTAAVPPGKGDPRAGGRQARVGVWNPAFRMGSVGTAPPATARGEPLGGKTGSGGGGWG